MRLPKIDMKEPYNTLTNFADPKNVIFFRKTYNAGEQNYIFKLKDLNYALR